MASATDQIASLYKDFLGRDADSEGLNYWTSQANSGMDMGTLTSNFLNGAKANGETINYNPGASLAAAASASSGGGGSGGGGSTSSASSVTPNVADWYRTSLGRDAEQGGLDFWQSQINSGMKAEDVYKSFQRAAQENGEIFKNVDWSQANSYSGPQSLNRATPVDDWGRNVLGRDLSADELKTWQARFDAAGGQQNAVQAANAVYQDFVKSYGGEVKNMMDSVTASQINPGLKKPIPTSPALIDLNGLAVRNIDPTTETVRGQLQTLLREDSPVLQQARADAMRVAADRGLLNSAMAASGGEDALIRNALGIATPDAGFYNKASDYNVAAKNQAIMWNADMENRWGLQNNQQQWQSGENKTQRDWQTGQNTADRGQQMTIAQMQNATTRYTAELNDKTSRYNTDASYKRQVDANNDALVNNVLMNTEMSPELKARMLEQLGRGTMAKKDASGKVTAGTGLAGAVYIIDSVAADLAPASGDSGGVGNNGGNN